QGHLLLYALTIMLLSVAYGTLALKGPFKIKLAMAAAMSCAYFHVYLIVVTLFTQFLTTRVSSQMLEAVSMLAYCMSALLFSKAAIRSNREIPEACWITLLLAAIGGSGPIYTSIMATGSATDASYSLGNVAISAGFLVILFTVLWLCSSVVSYYEQSMVGISLGARDSISSQLVKDYAGLVNEMRTAIHEKNHYLDSVAALLDMEAYDQARSLITEIRSHPMMKQELMHSGNAIVDAVLNQAIAQTEKLHIPFTAEACLTDPMPISDVELSSLLSNLISNALEASEHVTDPSISLRIYPARSYLCILVKNKVDETTMRNNPSLRTTKKDPRYHGIGLKVIETIAQRYHGLAEFEIADEHTFVATVMLRLDADD
ncbi:MAG: GHKL domain-containing protein, partial [Eubacteriales bacterium]|nr:GHKL domain-containing protein [Eubacteriales bacterium]